MAGEFRPDRKIFWIMLCAFLAALFCGSAKAQAVQAQTGSSESQAQAENAQKKEHKKHEQEKEKKSTVETHHQKKIKVHVVKEDKKPATPVTGPSVAPDKVLYARALVDIEKGRYTEGRLALQTLINTYPDSEYLAKAKLATADSYYKEGGISGLTQAVEEYKNFIIFFPFLDEAAYAQMQIGMAHFRMMEKPDRDNTQALDAEQEFQTFLLKYPKSPLVPQAEQHLREVQEIIADGEFRIAKFYYLKQDYPASAARLMELVERYPLYSQTDQALWMLASVYERAKHASKNEDQQNHWADLAAECYDRILQNYPLSGLAGQAKTRLTGMGMKIPPPDAEAMERMKREQMYDNRHRESTAFAFLKSPLALLKSSPSVANAAHFGMPDLNPPTDVISAREVLKQGAAGPDFELANQQLSAPLQAPPSMDDGTPVDANTSSPADLPQGTGVGAEIITPTTGTDMPANAQAASPSSTSAGATQPPSESQPAAPAADSPSGLSSLSGTVIGTASPTVNSQPAPASVAPVSGTSKPQGATQPASGSSAANAPAPQDASTTDKPDKKDKKYKTPKLDSSTESSSKKKKGIKKVIPW